MKKQKQETCERIVHVLLAPNLRHHERLTHHHHHHHHLVEMLKEKESLVKRKSGPMGRQHHARKNSQGGLWMMGRKGMMWVQVEKIEVDEQQWKRHDHGWSFHHEKKKKMLLLLMMMMLLLLLLG